MNKSSSLLDEITSLSKNDINNFMLHNTKFSDILMDKPEMLNHTVSCSNIVNNKKNRLNDDIINEEMHMRGKTTFNFDFNQGTFKTSLNGIEEQIEDKGSVNEDDINSDNITTNISPEENNDNKSKSNHTINLDNNNSFRISKHTTINYNSTATNTKIDFVIALLKPFYAAAFDDNVTQCTSNRSTTDEDYSLSLTKENIIVLSNEEISTMCIALIENETFIIGGTDKGALIVIEMSNKEIINRVNSPIDNNNLLSSMIKAICYYNKYIVCGFSNGFIVLYSIDIKGNVKKIEMIKNITTNAIISLKLFKVSDKKSIGIYIIDAIGNIFRCIVKRSLFKTKYETKTIITDNEYPYYDIDVMIENENIIAISNLKQFEVIDIDNITEPIMHINTNDNADKYSIVYLPSFFFSHNRTLYITVNNIMFIYKISKENTSILISSISYENPIIDIGLFSAEVVYVVDSEMKISLADYSNRTYLNDLLQLENELNSTNSIYHPKQQKFIKRYNNGVICKYKSIRQNDNCMFVFDIKRNIIKIGNVSVEEYIDKLINNESELKWKKSFDILIDIYNGVHPIYKVDSDLYEGIFNHISMKFVTDVFTSKSRISIHDYNKNLETKCNSFVYYLIKINHIDYIMKELLNYLSSINKQNVLFSLLEPYILTNNFRMNTITSSFITEMIQTYSQMNKRQIVCNLLLHLDMGIIISDESIYLKVISCKLYPLLLFISLHNKGRNFMKPIEIMLNELNYNNSDVDLLNEFDFNNDSKVYTKPFIILTIIWYINEILEKSNTMADEDNQKIIDLMQSEKIFNCFCINNDFINEYFYLIRKIIDKGDTTAKLKRSIVSLINSYLTKNTNDNKVTQIYYSFYILVIYIAATYTNVDLSNDIKIKSIVFLLSYHRFNESELVFDNIADALSGESPDSNNLNEDNMIKVIKGLDSITNDDSNAMLNACETSSCFMVRNFIKDLFTK